MIRKTAERVPETPLANVTRGPLPGSEKLYVEGTQPGVRVPVRVVRLQPTRRGPGLPAHENPPVRIYDTSGPYTDPSAQIDLRRGLPALRDAWIRGRGDVEELPAHTSAYGRA